MIRAVNFTIKVKLARETAEELRLDGYATDAQHHSPSPGVKPGSCFAVPNAR
jgi:hypothetical protein